MTQIKKGILKEELLNYLSILIRAGGVNLWLSFTASAARGTDLTGSLEN